MLSGGTLIKLRCLHDARRSHFHPSPPCYNRVLMYPNAHLSPTQPKLVDVYSTLYTPQHRRERTASAVLPPSRSRFYIFQGRVYYCAYLFICIKTKVPPGEFSPSKPRKRYTENKLCRLAWLIPHLPWCFRSNNCTQNFARRVPGNLYCE